jgi:hypothetical protein
MTFESMDDNRTVPWGYDAGFPINITGDFKIGDKVEFKSEFRSGEEYGREIQGFILWIRHPGEEMVERE